LPALNRPIVGVLAIAALWTSWWLLTVPIFLYGAYKTWATPRMLSSRMDLLSAG
jgi:hypothetical protein